MTPEEMRAKALECDAKTHATLGVKRMYAELANQWRELADQIERSWLGT